MRLYGLRPRPAPARRAPGHRVLRLRLVHWIHGALGVDAVVRWTPTRQQNRSCLPPTWTAQELGKRTAIERFFAGCLACSACLE